MRSALVVTLFLTLFLAISTLAGSSVAQDRPKQDLPNDAPKLPAKPSGVGIGPTVEAPMRSGQPPCVEVQIDHDVASPLDCLNRILKGQVDRVQPSMNVPPIDAKSQDPRVGVVNVPAVQQQYGKNFGVSVFPQRPPAPVYLNSFGTR
jgi:hypothetical protein